MSSVTFFLYFLPSRPPGNSGTCKQADVSAVAAFLAQAGLKLKWRKKMK